MTIVNSGRDGELIVAAGTIAVQREDSREIARGRTRSFSVGKLDGLRIVD